VPDQTGDLARHDVQREAVERLRGTEALAQFLDLEHLDHSSVEIYAV
jgi:hypothetical protein